MRPLRNPSIGGRGLECREWVLTQTTCDLSARPDVTTEGGKHLAALISLVNTPAILRAIMLETSTATHITSHHLRNRKLDAFTESCDEDNIDMFNVKYLLEY